VPVVLVLTGRNRAMSSFMDGGGAKVRRVVMGRGATMIASERM